MPEPPDVGADALGLHVRLDVDTVGHATEYHPSRGGRRPGAKELTRGNGRDTRRKRNLRSVASVERINIPLAARRCVAALMNAAGVHVELIASPPEGPEECHAR
ncbi:hypothetical protein GCM10011600_01880 [Pseudolysinimonas yzui]|uniref:Uncharacterized protein n=1 Tax=Pseudolysinimonas yzui TaxID=2708254 RepID=A0A8J3DSK7_9MICO|nr:hypothetical protein GCM10011600_01880 [Pseudolysinimonas yzui]